MPDGTAGGVDDFVSRALVTTSQPQQQSQGQDFVSDALGTTQPSFLDRLKAAAESYLPQPGESTLHAVGRDVEGLATGIVKPFATLGEAAINNPLTNPSGAPIKIPFTDSYLPEPSLGDVLKAAPQAAAAIFAGPAEGALAETLGGSALAKVAAGAAVGAGAGAIYNPSDPLVGATIGAGLGGPLGALRRGATIERPVSPETPFAPAAPSAEPAAGAALAPEEALGEVAKQPVPAEEPTNATLLPGPASDNAGALTRVGGGNDLVGSDQGPTASGGGTEGNAESTVGGGQAPPPPPPDGATPGDEGKQPGPSGFGFTNAEEEEYFSRFLNISKLGLVGPNQPGIAKILLRRVINDNGLDPKIKIGWQQTLAGAKNIMDSMTPQEIAALGAKQIRETGMMTRDVDAAHLLTAKRLIAQADGLGTAIRERNIPITQANELVDKLQEVGEDSQALLKNMIPSHSEKGRTLQALRIAANQTTDPTFWLMKAMKARGGPISGDEMIELNQAIDRARNAPNAFQKTRALNLLAAKVASFEYATPWQKSASLIRANLLSSPSSLVGAAAGHLAFAGLDATDKNLAGFYDLLVGSATGQRTRSFAPIADMRARVRGMVQAAKGVPGLIRTGSSDVAGVVDQRELEWDHLADQASAGALERVTDPLLRAGNTTLGVYAKMILRMYGVIPHIIRGGAMEASLESQARIIAMSENLGGQLLEDRVKAIRQEWRSKGAPDLVQRQAAEDAAVAALTNQGYLASGTRKIKQGIGAAFGGPGELAASAAMPFTTVPSNLIEQGLKHSPFAGAYGAMKLGQLFTKSMSGVDRLAVQRAAVDNMARASTGAAAMLAGYLLAKAGRATGPADDANRRAVAVMTGRQPDAIRLGSEWYNDERFAPVSELVEMGAYFHDFLNDPHAMDKTGFLKGAANAYVQSVQDAPFATGVKYLADVFSEPGNAGTRYVTDVARGAVPTVFFHAEEAMDPFVRQADMSHGLAQGLLQTAEARIPIPAVYNRVPVKPNPLGLPTTHETGPLAAFSPYPATTDLTLTDPVMRAIAESNVNLPPIKREPNETDAEYNARIGLISRAAYGNIARLVESEGWRNIDTEADRIAANPRFAGHTPAEISEVLKQELIEKVVGQVKSRAARATSPTAAVPYLLKDLVNPPPDQSTAP